MKSKNDRQKYYIDTKTLKYSV